MLANLFPKPIQLSMSNKFWVFWKVFEDLCLWHKKLSSMLPWLPRPTTAQLIELYQSSTSSPTLVNQSSFNEVSEFFPHDEPFLD